MITINRSSDLITGSYNGEQFSVTYDEQKYNLMLNLQQRANEATSMDQLLAAIEEFKVLAQEDYKNKVETASEYIVGNKHTNKFYLRYGNKISSEPLPQVFVDKILKSVDKGIDVTPLIKCWARYMRPIPGRPKYNQEQATLFAKYIDADYVNEEKISQLMDEHGISHEVARARATTKQVAITMEGLLVCYKVSTELLDQYALNEKEEVERRSRFGKSVDPDTGVVTYNKAAYAEDRVFEPKIMGQRGDAFYCGDKLGHIIKVGQSHYLPEWKQVGRPGERGLHCGGLNYIKGYQSEGTVTHNILVDPMDIHTIAGLGIGNDGAMTVRRYFVHSTFDSVNKNIYHSSTYAAITDGEYAGIVKEAVEAHEMKLKEMQEKFDFDAALQTTDASSRGGVKAAATGDLPF
jgi:hypothetical protein